MQTFDGMLAIAILFTLTTSWLYSPFIKSAVKLIVMNTLPSSTVKLRCGWSIVGNARAQQLNGFVFAVLFSLAGCSVLGWAKGLLSKSPLGLTPAFLEAAFVLGAIGLLVALGYYFGDLIKHYFDIEYTSHDGCNSNRTPRGGSFFVYFSLTRLGLGMADALVFWPGPIQIVDQNDLLFKVEEWITLDSLSPQLRTLASNRGKDATPYLHVDLYKLLPLLQDPKLHNQFLLELANNGNYLLSCFKNKYGNNAAGRNLLLLAFEKAVKQDAALYLLGRNDFGAGLCSVAPGLYLNVYTDLAQVDPRQYYFTIKEQYTARVGDVVVARVKPKYWFERTDGFVSLTKAAAFEFKSTGGTGKNTVQGWVKQQHRLDGTILVLHESPKKALYYMAHNHKSGALSASFAKSKAAGLDVLQTVDTGSKSHSFEAPTYDGNKHREHFGFKSKRCGLLFAQRPKYELVDVAQVASKWRQFSPAEYAFGHQCFDRTLAHPAISGHVTGALQSPYAGLLRCAINHPTSKSVLRLT